MSNRDDEIGGDDEVDSSWQDEPINLEVDTGAKEIANTALPGQYGYGWKYYDNGTAISPDGKYYYQGDLVWSPGDAEGNRIFNSLKGAFVKPDGSVNWPGLATAALGI